MIDPLLIRAMKAAGVSDAQVVAVMEAYSEAKREDRREAERAKKARYRASLKSRENNIHVHHVHMDSGDMVDMVDNSAPSRADIITTRAPAVIPVGISNDIPPNVIPPIGPPSDTTAPRKARRAKPRTSISEDAQPGERERADANQAGLTGEQFRDQWRRFRDYHLQHGSLMASWPAAWRTWLGNIGQFQRAGPRPKQSPLLQARQQILEELENANTFEPNPYDPNVIEFSRLQTG